MPPQDTQQIKQILFSHQHTGGDFTQKLRNQDWQQIGKAVLFEATTSIRVDIPPKLFLRILIQWGAKSGASNDFLRFNNVSTGDVYTFIEAGGTARTSQNQIDLRDALNSALGGFSIIDVVNNPTLVKPVIIHTSNRITSAATAQTFNQIFGTFVNTTLPITRIDLVSSDADTYPSGSSIVVLSTKE